MLHIFGRYFFPDAIRGEYDTPEAHLDLIRALASPESSGIIFPRGFAKSTWERIDTLHDVVYGLEPLVVFYADTGENAAIHIDWVKSQLEDNAELRYVYGNLVPDRKGGKGGRKWNSRRIKTTNNVTVIGGIAGKGRGINIGGHRPTKVVVDDGETDDMVRSAMRRETYWRWLNEVIDPSLDKERGRMKVVGTIIHPKCAVRRYFEEKGGILRRAIEGGKSIWPEYWSLADLFRKRDGYMGADGKWRLGIGAKAFSQEYLNEPLGDGLTMFRLEWVDNNTWEPGDLPKLPLMDVVMALDPAAGESSLADDYGACVIGRDRSTGIRYVLWSGKYQGGIGSVTTDKEGNKVRTGAMLWFHDIYVAWNPTICGIEASMTVQAFWQLVRDSGEYRVRKLAPSMGVGGKNAAKVERAKLVEPLVEQGRVKFSPAQGTLYEQITCFPSAGVKDDVFDAFMHANSLLDAGDAKMIEAKPTVTGTSRIKSRNF